MHSVAKQGAAGALSVGRGGRIWRMGPLTSTMLWSAATMGVAAAALSVFVPPQRGVHGHRWWAGALWLNAAAAAAAALVSEPIGELWAPWWMVPWPMLCLWGLRSFHARDRLPGSPRSDLLALAAATLAALWVGGTHSAPIPMLAGGLALLYAAALLWMAPVEPDAAARRVLASTWCVAGLLLLSAALWPVPGAAPALHADTHAGIVALASLATAFVLLASISRRTERELRESRRRLRVLANIDMLTQVPNRRRFEELARRALQADAPGSAALLLVDIDHFKQINDKLGHAAGDRALKLVSRCTLELLRAQDVAGRHGGDEFVLLLRKSSTQEAMQVAERLVAHLQTKAHAHALPRLSLSFGIVQMRAGESIDDTLQRADLALYEAKRLGRSRAVASDGGPDDRPAFRSSHRLGLTSS